MSLNVSIPKEITDYKGKFFGGLSLRKLLCLGGAILSGIGTYTVSHYLLNLSASNVGTIVMVVAAPPLAFGFVEKDGMALEKYMALYLRHRFGTQKLPYAAEPVIGESRLKKSEKEGVKNNVCLFQKKRRGRRSEAGSADGFYQSTRKERQRNCAAARTEIEAARKEYLAAKKAHKKSTGRGSQIHDTDNRL